MLYFSHWVSVWNPNATVDLGDAGFGAHTGFFGSKSAQGFFDTAVNVTNCGGCSWSDVSWGESSPSPEPNSLRCSSRMRV
jgi:hypothetical protein